MSGERIFVVTTERCIFLGQKAATHIPTRYLLCVPSPPFQLVVELRSQSRIKYSVVLKTTQIQDCETTKMVLTTIALVVAAQICGCRCSSCCRLVVCSFVRLFVFFVLHDSRDMFHYFSLREVDSLCSIAERKRVLPGTETSCSSVSTSNRVETTDDCHLYHPHLS